MKRLIKANSTDQTVYVWIADSTATNGSGKTGLVYNSAGLKCYYLQGPLGSATVINLATQTVGGAHSDGGFVEIDATNMPGLYRLDLPDILGGVSKNQVIVILHGATGMAPVVLEFQLVDFDPMDFLGDIDSIVVGCLTTDTYAESAAVPAATASLKDKICWLATLARNKINQTATTQAVRNDADGANIATAAVSTDGTTFTRAEWTT